MHKTLSICTYNRSERIPECLLPWCVCVLRLIGWTGSERNAADVPWLMPASRPTCTVVHGMADFYNWCYESTLCWHGPGRAELQEVHAGVQEDNNESLPPAGEDDDLQDNWHHLQMFGRFLPRSSSCEECDKKIGTNVYLNKQIDKDHRLHPNTWSVSKL